MERQGAEAGVVVVGTEGQGACNSMADNAIYDRPEQGWLE